MADHTQALIELFEIDTSGMDQGSIYHAIAACLVELVDEADAHDAEREATL